MVFAGKEGIERIGGMHPGSHRFQSLGHDPVLGFIFGVLDIMRGTITGFSYDMLTGDHTFMSGQVWSNLKPVGLIEAILKHLGHLISDVGTPMGLPAPMMTALQGLNVGRSFCGGKTVGQLARWMYQNGYDFRHFLVSGITPAVIEIILRGYLMIRHFVDNGEVKIRLADNPKYRSMLLLAHAIAAAANAGKVALYQGNPLAINQAQWMALFRYLIPSLKYWLFDRDRLELEHLRRINDEGWKELIDSSRSIIERVAPLEMPLFELGKD